MTQEKMVHLEQEKHEQAYEYVGRLLASMFQEVYAHTGREMPTEMFDRCDELARELRTVVRDEVGGMQLR